MAASNPSVIVQHDWHIDVKAQQGRFWISIRTQPDAPTKHGNVFVSPEGLRTDLNAQVKHENGVLTVTLPDLPVHTFQFQSPEHTFAKVLERKILSFDVAPSEAYGVCAGDQGQLRIIHFETPTLNRSLGGHIGDVNTCRFFPSGEVVLSGGADLTLRIWSAIDGSCARTLKGHTGGVLGTAFIGRGRNFLSCARDGSVRLWDCASASCIRTTLTPSPAAPHVNAVAVLAPSEAPAPSSSAAAAAVDEREIGTEGSCVAAACGDGHVRVIDLRSSKLAFDAVVATGASVNGVAVVGGDTSMQVAAGCSSGAVVWWDLRATRALRTVVVPAVVTALSSSHDTVYVGAEDGQCWVFGEEARGATIRTLTGADIDPIYDVRVGATAVYTGARDAAVRRYRHAP